MGMFYACKSSDFWRDIRRALTEIFPDMAETIAAQAGLQWVETQPRQLSFEDTPPAPVPAVFLQPAMPRTAHKAASPHPFECMATSQTFQRLTGPPGPINKQSLN